MSAVPPSPAKPVREYLKTQGRFAHLDDAQVAAIQAEVDARWKRLLALESIA